jgi:hypothetical protein
MMKLPRLNALGHSAYLSEINSRTPDADTASGVSLIFISLHIKEEFGNDFVHCAEEWIHSLNEKGYKVLADVSKETLEQFNEKDIIILSKRLGLWGVRLDYGFSLQEICSIAEKMPVAVNASTITREEAAVLAKAGPCVMAMHNFYPRPETGLDEDYLQEMNAMLHTAGMKVLAFIPGTAKSEGRSMKASLLLKSTVLGLHLRHIWTLLSMMV